jgi:ketosteroid isomerase-like protein
MTEQATRTAINHFPFQRSLQWSRRRRFDNALAAWLTEDTVFEDTSPAPDGRRIEGKTAVVDFWRRWFARNSDARFDAEELIICGDRAVVPLGYHKMRNRQPGHLRGVDLFTVRDGKVAAKLA